MPKPKKPIRQNTRIGEFFTMKDFNLEVQIGREYLKTDVPSKIFLYRIDRIKTQYISFTKKPEPQKKRP